MDKPISLIIEETKKSLVNTINTCGLHISIIEMIMRELYTEISQVSNANAIKEKELYLQKLKSTPVEE